MRRGALGRRQANHELFGNGMVLSMEVDGDQVVGAALGGVRYRRVSP
ncbi:MAG: hypothetical protein ACT4PM_04465 [Gemmatimonadales bacterium]